MFTQWKQKGEAFLNSALDGDEWLTSRSGRFTLSKEPKNPLNRKLGGPQSRSGRFKVEINFFPSPGFEPGTVQPVSLVEAEGHLINVLPKM